jgi:hypothetical protein
MGSVLLLSLTGILFLNHIEHRNRYRSLTTSMCVSPIQEEYEEDMKVMQHFHSSCFSQKLVMWPFVTKVRLINIVLIAIKSYKVCEI